MKNHLLKIFLLNIALVLTAGRAFAVDTYDWIGNNSSANNWTDPTNWRKNNATQTAAGTVPGNNASDIVYVGVNYTYTVSGHTYSPSLATNTTVTIASLTYGNNFKATSATNNAGRSDMALTVGSATTTATILNITGTFLQTHSSTGGTAYSGGTDVTGATPGTVINAIKTTISGFGTIHCSYFQVGDNTVPGNPFVINNTNVTVGNSSNSTISIIVDNDLTLNSKSTNSTTVPADDPGGDEATRNNNASLDFVSGTITIVNGSLKLSNTDYKGYVLAIYAASVTFKMFTTGTTVAPTLNLGGAVPIAMPAPPPVYAANVIDFWASSATPYPVVNYTGITDQTVYTYNATGYPERYIDFASTVYGSIGFSGSGNKILEAGAFTVTGNFTLMAGSETVNLSTNKPTLTVTHDFSTAANTTFTNGTVASGCNPVSIRGNFNNDGTCNFSDPLVTFNSAIPVTFTATSPVTFTNVRFNGGGDKNMNTGIFNVAPTGVLSINATTQLAANGHLYLKSDVTGTASVATIPTGSSITGDVTAERYMSARRSYRLISSPVHTGSLDPINGVYYTSFAYLKNTSGMWLTGYSNDFDKNVLAAGTGPTLYLYREDVPFSNATFVSGNFRDIRSFPVAPATDTLTYTIDTDGAFKIPAATGVQAYFRGNKSVPLATATAPGAPATSATFAARGSLNTGQIVFQDWFTIGSNYLSATQTDYNQRYNLVGNPYPSAIDWDKLDSTNTTTNGIYGKGILTSIYMLNPATGNYGVYMSGNGGLFGTNGANNLIASGQGFYVTAFKSNARLIFNEAGKTTSQNTGTTNLFMGKPVTADNVQFMRLQLAKDSINTDDMVIRFNSDAGTAFSRTEDAEYKSGQGQVSICSFSSDHVALAINQLPFTKNMQAIGLKVGAATNGTYKLNLTTTQGIPVLYDIWLLDNFTKDSVNMRLSKSYSFNILKTDTNTYGSKRFVLFIRQNALYAYKLVSFNGQKAEQKVSLVWKTQNEANYTHFTVLRSTDNGKTFDVIGGTTSSDQGTYTLDDRNPVTGANLYKLKQEDVNGDVTYSDIVTVMYSNKMLNAGNKISVYPNPASGPISLSVPDNKSSNNFNIRIVNSSGVVVKQIASAPNEWQGNVSGLLTGTYVIEVVNNKDKSLVGQAKLVKL